jgi:hypothetical protein
MTGHRDGVGDPAYLDGALARLETGQPLRAVDRQELSSAVGREAACTLIAAAQQTSGRRKARSSGWWGRWFPPIHTRPELPVPVARLIARLRSGEAVSARDANAVARLAGRATVRAVSRRATRSARAALRGVSRSRRRQARRRGWSR